MNHNHQTGQTLVELIIAISVITIGMFSVWSLALSSYTAEREAQLRFTGANLAREGVEIVKNIRDSNWLRIDDNELCGADSDRICDWNEGLTVGDYVPVGFENVAAPTLTAVDDIADDQTIIYKDDSQGFFTHNSNNGNTRTAFRRMISIQAICCVDGDNNRQCDNLDSDSGMDWSPKATCGPTEYQIGIDVMSKVTWLYNDEERESVVQAQLFNWR